MGLLKKARIAAGILVPVLGLAGVCVANAGTGPSDIFSVTGSGAINPGLPTTGCAVHPAVTFAGTVTFTPNSRNANLSGGSLTFNGTGSACATVTQDSGSGTLSGVFSGTVSFVRSGNGVQVTGTVTLNGSAEFVTADCEFVPTNANPTTAYQLACQAELTDTGSSDVVSVVGGGQINPGLPTTGCAVDPAVTFAGTVTFTPNSRNANLSGSLVTFNGTGSTCGTLTQDSGSGTLGGVFTGTVSFVREGNEVQVAGTATLNGVVHTITADCEFVPTNFNPTTAYQLACQAVLGS